MDRCLEIGEGARLPEITPNEWVQCCQKRIPKARGKAWFAIKDSFSMLDGSWTILSETISHVEVLEKVLKESGTI